MDGSLNDVVTSSINTNDVVVEGNYLTDVMVDSTNLTDVVVEGIKKYSKRVLDRIVHLKDKSLNYLRNISLPYKRKLFLSTAALVFSISAIPGCVSEQTIDEQLALTPKYFQGNVGEGHIVPKRRTVLNVPIALFADLNGAPKSRLDKHDPNCSYYTSLFATRWDLSQEQYHSFDLRCALYRYWEWQRSSYDFYQGKPQKPNLPI